MKPKIIYLILLIIIFTDCANQQKGQDGNQLIIGIRSEPKNLTPLFPASSITHDLFTLIFSSLMELNDDLQTFTPNLAKSFQFSRDSLEITFTLRSDLFWHDGTKLTAEDVVFTHYLQTNKSIGWDGISYKQHITKVKAPDDTTVVFTFKKKTPFMILDAVEGVILPKHILGKIDPRNIFQSDFSRHPVGSGPYQLQEWKNQQYLILKKNEYYYEPGKPEIPQLIFKIVNEPAILYSQFLANEIDIIHDLPIGYYNKIDTTQGNVKILKYSGKDYDFIGWNLVQSESFIKNQNLIRTDPQKYIRIIQPHPILANIEIRKALTGLINKEKICKNLCNTIAAPINGPYVLFGEQQIKALEKKSEENRKEALNILENQGWRDHNGDGILDKNGRDFVLTVYTNAGNSLREQILMILEQDFLEAGIKIIPKIVEGNFLVSEIIPNKKFDAVLLGWNASIKPDFTPLFASSQYLHPFHLTGYYSPEFDRLNQNMLDSKTMKEYSTRLNQLINHLVADQPCTWLFARKKIFVFNTKIKNVDVSMISTFKYLKNFKY